MSKKSDFLRDLFSVLAGVKEVAPKAKETAKRFNVPVQPRPLALPAPAAPLPKYAVKPRGGNWVTAKTPAAKEIATDIITPEYAAEKMLREMQLDPDSPLTGWLQKSLPKYLKVDFGTPEDPMLSLVREGLVPTRPNPIDWGSAVKLAVTPTRASSFLGYGNLFGKTPAEFAFARENDKWYQATIEEMPWLEKIPATEPVYYMNFVPREVGDVVQDLKLATSGAPELPRDLALDPSSLPRMSFGNAIERAKRIRQWRIAKEAEDKLNNPAIQTFKEYPEEGMRWVELKAPEGAALSPEDRAFLTKVRDEDAYRDYMSRHEDPKVRDLYNALRDESDVVQHCVGKDPSYCINVLDKKARIFSLRDAKGEAHATVETRSNKSNRLKVYNDFLRDEMANNKSGFVSWLRDKYAERPEYADANPIDVANEYLAEQGRPALKFAEPAQAILQIKGKQNTRPSEKYLPFVQDFVKSGKWDDVEDLRNTNLVRLPDGRYLDSRIVNERLEQRAKDRGDYDPAYWERERDRYHTGLDPDQWDQLKDYFEGYAKGGAVKAKNCGCNPAFVVKKAKGGGAWTRKEGKNPEGGLNAKGRASLRAQGHDIKPPVSAKQAKKSPKAAARRRSFCARMSGMPGPMKDEKGRPTRKALSLRKWDC